MVNKRATHPTLEDIGGNSVSNALEEMRATMDELPYHITLSRVQSPKNVGSVGFTSTLREDMGSACAWMIQTSLSAKFDGRSDPYKHVASNNTKNGNHWST